MTPRINPFSPNAPVHQGTFVGRLDELERLEASLFQAAAGNPTNFMITGERGIGKTSLLNYIHHVAAGYIPVEDQSLRFLVVDTVVDPATTQRNLLRKLELGLRKSLKDTEAVRSWLKEA